NLLQRVHHLDEIALVLHHLVDVLVGARDLVDHAAVLAADDAGSLLGEVAGGESLHRLRTAHASAGAVRAGLEALLRAPAAHDVRARAHAAGDDAEVPLPRPYRALARHPHVLAIVLLALDVVVMAVDRLAGHLERRQMAPQGGEHKIHH